MRVLVVEDEKDLNRVITRKLKAEGYSVDSCFDGAEALDYMEMTPYDVIVMDIMMPEKNGYQVLKEMREKGNRSPVLFLTARDALEDRVKGLDLGADDYLIKPFDFDELLARIRVLTRKRSTHRTSVITISDLKIDTGSHSVIRGARPIELSSREYAILEYMALNQGRVLSREQIEDHVWNFDYSGGTNVVDVYISYLRKKIDSGEEKKLIRTVWGTGWMLKEDA